jgi:hypothetical protein
VEYEFSTAWSPPEQFLEKVAVQWPALQFVLEYEEPGMAVVCCRRRSSTTRGNPEV